MKTNIKEPLDNAVKQHYLEKNLEDHQMNELQEMLNNAHVDNSSSSQYSLSNWLAIFKGRALPVAFASLLVFSVVWMFEQPNVQQNIAGEIAYNHNKQMAPEIISASLDDIDVFLSKLDFQLIRSSHFNDKQWEIVGGRYCSIGGHLAAQLKIKNKTENKLHTVYQALLPKDFEPKNKTIDIFVDGVKVKMWEEKGLLIGLAG